MTTKHELPGFNGITAFDGALRFIDANNTWMSRWGDSYGDLAPKLKLVASDAFGTMYGLDEAGKMSIFWSETGEIESLDIDEHEFFSLIAKDPDGTINLDLYQAAVQKLGQINQNQHFAFKVETAMGGLVALDNLMIMDADEHMRSLGAIAQQIRNIQPGTKINIHKADLS